MPPFSKNITIPRSRSTKWLMNKVWLTALVLQVLPHEYFFPYLYTLLSALFFKRFLFGIFSQTCIFHYDLVAFRNFWCSNYGKMYLWGNKLKVDIVSRNGGGGGYEGSARRKKGSIVLSMQSSQNLTYIFAVFGFSVCCEDILKLKTCLVLFTKPRASLSLAGHAFNKGYFYFVHFGSILHFLCCNFQRMTNIISSYIISNVDSILTE